MAREAHTKRFAGLPSPAYVIYEPVAGDIAQGPLRTFYQRWLDDIAAGRAVPGEEILEYPEIAPLHRNLNLLRVIRLDALHYDYRYHIYGADIAEHYGTDLTGHLVSELPEGIFKLFTDLYETAISRKIVIHSLHTPPMAVNVKKWERLIFPLGEAEVKWLLVISLPKGKRREA